MQTARPRKKFNQKDDVVVVVVYSNYSNTYLVAAIDGESGEKTV